MKHVKLIMVITVLILGTGGAIMSAHASRARGPLLAYARNYAPGEPREAFVSMYHVAEIQDISRYHGVGDPDVGPSPCNASTNVCTYINDSFDPAHPDMRQYNAGDHW